MDHNLRSLGPFPSCVFILILTLAPVVGVGPEELAESLEDRLAVAAVAHLHVAVQRVQTLVSSRVARVAKVALDLWIGGLKVGGVDEGDVNGEEVLLGGADVADWTPEVIRCI